MTGRASWGAWAFAALLCASGGCSQGEAAGTATGTSDGATAATSPSDPTTGATVSPGADPTDGVGDGLAGGGAAGTAAGAIDPTTPSTSGGAGTTGAGAQSADCPDPGSGMRDVLLVGNGVGGTVSFLDACSFDNLGSVDIIPDFDEVMSLINQNPLRLIAYPIVKSNQVLHHFEPQAGDRFVDDVFVSPAGTTLYVSRSNLGDVAAFDLTSPGHPRLWRTFVSGLKADHATISQDGTRLVVSSTTTNTAEVFDASTGQIVGSFPTGNFPHQNDYSADGKYVYNSSIGNVGTNVVPYADNALKGDRWLIKVDAETLQEVDRWVFEWGIRPNVITPDGSMLYTQLSYLNGVIKYDLATKTELARSDQPLSQFALDTYATYDEYPHDSAHHGLALSGDGTRLCDCGTIDNTVSIVSTETMEVLHLIDVGLVPYWATTSPDGRHCLVSLSGDDAVSVIDYETGTEVRVVPVGRFPQRNRVGRVPESVIELLSASPG